MIADAPIAPLTAAPREGHLRRLLDGSRALVVSLDLAGTVTYCNRALLDLVGWREADVLGRSWFDLCVPRGAEARRLFEANAADGAIPAHFESEVVTRTGERRLVAWDNSVLRDDADRVVGTASLGRDVTEARTAERQLRLSEEELQRAQRLEAVGRLAGGVAHDFNNVLTVVRCAAEMVLAQLAADDPCREDVLEIAQTAERAGGLTRQLVAFSRTQVARPEEVDAEALLAYALVLARRAVPASIELVTVAAHGVGRVRVDRAQLEQALLALVSNARDALPGAGTISVEARDETLEEPRVHRHGIVKPGEYVAIRVTDDGVGMDDAVLGRLFEPLFTTKEKGRGAGLGLATVYGIVKQSRGHVLVESTPGRGSVFTLYLPRVGPASSTVRAAVPAGAPGAAGGETVLLVEDETTVRELLRRILQRSGYTVLEARHGADALLILERHPDSIDLVMTDVVMPAMGGRELLEQLRARRPTLKVVVMSGYAPGEFLQGNARGSAVRFLQKPFTGDAVLRAVREALDFRLR